MRVRLSRLTVSYSTICACIHVHAQVFEASQKRAASNMLASLRFIKWVASTHLQDMKAGVNNLISNAKDELFEQLTPMLRPDVSPGELRSTLDACLNIFKHVETEKQEIAEIRARLGKGREDSAWIDPVRRDLVDPTGVKSGDFVYDFPLDVLLKRLFLNNPQVCPYSWVM